MYVKDEEAEASEPEAVEDEPARAVEDEPAEDEPVADEPAAAEEEPEETAPEQVDDEPTAVREAVPFGRPVNPEPVSPSLAGPAAAGASVESLSSPSAMAGLYRGDADETQVLEPNLGRRTLEDEAREEEARAAALRAEKEERDRRLGTVQTSEANAEREVRSRRRGVGGFGSFGLFVLRLVTAAILGVIAYQVLYSIDDTAEFLAQRPLIPEPRLMAWIVGFSLAAMAVMLIIGLGVRIVGFLLASLAIATLSLIRWGAFSPFVEGMEGFLGDRDLLLAAVGFLFLSIGGGRLGIDGAISRAREEAREAKHV